MGKKTVRRFVDPNKVGTKRPKGSDSTVVYAGMKDAEWNCNSCGTENIQSTTKICPNCRNPKDKSEAYHSPSVDRPYLTEKNMEERGIDRDRQKDETCPFCGSGLTSKTEVCPNCGGNIEEVYKADRVCTNCGRETNKKACDSCGAETVTKKSLLSQAYPASLPRSTPQTPTPKKNNNILLVAGAILLACLFFGGLYMIFRPHDEVASVYSNNWTCKVPQMENQYNFHSDWTLPEGADLVRSYEKFHHNIQVEDGLKEVCEDKWEVVGYEDKPKTKEVCVEGDYIETIETCDDETNVCTYEDVYEDDVCSDVPDGTEKVAVYDWVEHCEDKMQYKDKPVNQMFYEYNIWEWVAIQPATSSGNDNLIACPIITNTDLIRQSGDPSTTCSTEFLVGEKLYSYSPDCNTEFQKYSENSVWQVTISGPSIVEVQYVP